jgi:hypothetical protein
VFPLQPKAKQTKTQNQRKLSVISSSTAQAFMSSTKEKEKNKPPTLDHSSFFNSKSNKHNWKSRAILKANCNKQTGNQISKQNKKKQQNLALDDLEKL